MSEESEVFDWVKDVPKGMRAKAPGRMKWRKHIASALLLMEEHRFGRAEAVLLVAEKQKLNKKQAESFRVCFGKKVRELEAENEDS